MPTHADIATTLVAKLPPGVFGRAALAAVAHQDFTTLKQMLPSVTFETMKVAVDEWHLIGTCDDGTVAAWRVGG